MNSNSYYYSYQLIIWGLLMYICICKKITDTQIHQEVENGATTLKELSKRLGVSTQCGKCGKCARNMIRRKVSEMASFPINLVAG